MRNFRGGLRNFGGVEKFSGGGLRNFRGGVGLRNFRGFEKFSGES